MSTSPITTREYGHMPDGRPVTEYTSTTAGASA